MLYLVRPQQADHNMATIARDRRLIMMLLYRHYQRHGGLILSPIATARQAVDIHALAVKSARQQGVLEDQLPRVIFPNW